MQPHAHLCLAQGHVAACTLQYGGRMMLASTRWPLSSTLRSKLKWTKLQSHSKNAQIYSGTQVGLPPYNTQPVRLTKAHPDRMQKPW
jgi:hypothetical protein